MPDLGISEAPVLPKLAVPNRVVVPGLMLASRWRGGLMASTERGELLGQRSHSREANSGGRAGLG